MMMYPNLNGRPQPFFRTPVPYAVLMCFIAFFMPRRNTLTDPTFVDLLHTNDFVVWGGDVRDKEGWSGAFFARCIRCADLTPNIFPLPIHSIPKTPSHDISLCRVCLPPTSPWLYFSPVLNSK